MALTKLEENMDIIQQLDDEPNDVGGLTADQLKAQFDRAGNLVKAYINNTLTAELDQKFKDIYPVGSIYMSVNAANPGTLFGGTWEQLKDRFLVAAGGSYTAEATGGAATVTLKTANLPAHNHTGRTNDDGLHDHGGPYNSSFYVTRGDKTADISGVQEGGAFGESGNNGGMARQGLTAYGGTHSHAFTTSTVGSGAAFSNLPPYLAVYMWKRTA